MNRSTIACQLRRLAEQIEAQREVPKPVLSADQMAGRVAQLLEAGYNLEAALLPLRLRYGDSREYDEMIARLVEAVRDVRTLGEELGGDG